MITATVSFNITPLPDDDIWFLNAAAWNNYWTDLTADIELVPVDNNFYVPVPYNNGLQPAALDIDGNVYLYVTVEMFNSLKAELQNLNASYQALRIELRDAGLITNAQ